MVMLKEDCEKLDINSSAYISTMCNSFEGKSLFCFCFLSIFSILKGGGKQVFQLRGPTPRKSSPEVFYQKSILKNVSKFTGKYLCQSLFFNKVAGLWLGTFLKKRLCSRCFPVNCAKFLRTNFLKENLRYASYTPQCSDQSSLD